MAPNIRYINQTAPFWDWIASFEDRASSHPFFNNNQSGNSGPAGPAGPGDHPHHHPHPPHHGPPPPGPPPPFGAWGRGPWHGPWGGHWHSDIPHHGPPPPFSAGPEASSSSETEKENDNEKTRDVNMGESADAKEKNPADPVPDPPEDTPGEGCPGRRHRRGGPRGACGRRGGERRHGGPHAWGHHHPYGHGHGHGHGPGHGRGFGGPRGFGFLQELFGGAGGASSAAEADNDWKPDADVFDTESMYVVHLSLPGAHKEDIGVAWDPEKSELTVSGVVHRPGDEEFLKALALDERKVGAFERKIRLGTRANPAQVDVDGIVAKLENGILVVEVPKLNGEFVEIKKVDIE